MIIQSIRTGKLSKIVASYLALQLILQVAQPTAMWALTGGPKQPEFNSFTPIGTSDMVDLASGDFNYNIPIMDVGGYPLNLSYQSGVTMDQEASWVGLGWNLNVGQINRQVRGIPDDFKGDEIKYTDELKPNKTIGIAGNFNAAVFGGDLFKLGVGLGLDYNNYTGNNINFSIGPTFALNGIASVGFKLNGSSSNGASVSPSVSLSAALGEIKDLSTSLGGSLGVTYNSRQGLSSLNLSASLNAKSDYGFIYKGGQGTLGSFSSSLSFAKPTYTPTKRVNYNNSNFSISLAAGVEAFGIEPQGQLTGYVGNQTIANPFRSIKAYGYEHTDLATPDDVLDFNRENDRVVSLNTNVLASTSYTYDLYTIQGQGIGGQFRSHRSQVGFVYDNYVADRGNADAVSAEVGVGNIFHAGSDLVNTQTKSHTGLWRENNKSIARLNENYKSDKPQYEKTYFKSVGQLDVDDESMNILKNKLANEKVINFGVQGPGKLNANYQYETSQNGITNPPHQITARINETIQRNDRAKRNQLIQKFTFDQVEANNDYFIESRSELSSEYRKGHHTAGFKILQPDGSNYIFGRSVYNTKKIEVTLDVSGESQSAFDKKNGVIEASVKKASSKSDQFLNKIETPAYPHSYLLTSILSSDYEDINNNGIDENDLGSYTKFTYQKSDGQDLYKWRVPYDYRYSTYNEGLESLKDDQKGNYLYGEKEIFYTNTIETKTHIAVFELEDREDGLGAEAENTSVFNQLSASERRKGRLKRIKTISLYSKPDYDRLQGNATPIKIAHFDYSYDLCKSVSGDSNFNGASGKGKLTLQKVWFTYKNSKLGRYTPYEFEYSDFNPKYQIKSYDIWGNYKPFTISGTSNIGPNGALSSAEYPYVNQGDREEQDQYVSAWSLKAINLPSGGKIDLELEADSYNYVQDKKAMRMFKILGVGKTSNPNSGELEGTDLVGAEYIYIPLDEADKTDANFNVSKFKSKYVGNHYEKPIYFRFMLNMSKRIASDKYDYVTGYLNINRSSDRSIVISKSSGYAAIPIEFRELGGGVNGKDKVNPISKAGWFFARKYLNTLVFTGNEYNGGSIKSFVRSLVNAVSSYREIFIGPNGVLKEDGIARYCIPNKSWIRLLNPRNEKIGGGSRVKSLKMYDNWSNMAGQNHTEKYYGQEYSYLTENGSSSGVATFEPNASKENPLILPINDDHDRLLAPASENYVETPMGATFFPSPKVTYGSVRVSNLSNGAENLKLHASGSVVTEFYTSRRFPTISTFSGVDKDYKSPGVASPFKLKSRESITLSQGFCVITNDMDGKQKSQSVYEENFEDADDPNKNGNLISRVEYEYNVANDNPNKLNNNFITIDEQGAVKNKVIGVDYDVINDFRESKSSTKRLGGRYNLATFLVFPAVISIGTVFPELNDVESSMYTASTTKVIHKRGVLKRKIAYDLGASVTTENLAWDSNTGNVLVTKTENEYDDAYYNVTYPAYWHYKGMGLASDNFRIKGSLRRSTSNYFRGVGMEFLSIGDELKTSLSNNRLVDVDNDEIEDRVDQSRLWVVDKNSSGVTLMTTKGYVLNLQCNDFQVNSSFDYEIVRSGKRNQQTATMASVTTKTNPIIRQGDSYRNLEISSNVINASAVEYSDFWEAPKEDVLPILGLNSQIENTSNHEAIGYGFNPYRYNVKGSFRAIESYAFLSNRSNFNQANLSEAGNISDFQPFYKRENNQWTIDKNKWTSASKVVKFHPNGNELENEDALGRYSSAQYGFNNTLPIAVASNSGYNEMAFDSFEDYNYNNISPPSQINYNIKHFDLPYYSEKLNENSFEISNKEYHSGRNSLKVLPRKNVIIDRNIGNCNSLPIQATDCESNNRQTSVVDFVERRIGIPDTGIRTPNNATPRPNVRLPESFYYFRNKYDVEGSFKIVGSPFEKISMAIALKDRNGNNYSIWQRKLTLHCDIWINEEINSNPIRMGYITDDPSLKPYNINYLDKIFYLDENGEAEIRYSLGGGTQSAFLDCIPPEDPQLGYGRYQYKIYFDFLNELDASSELPSESEFKWAEADYFNLCEY